MQKSLETKERILHAAKKEFAERGFDGARMGSIARRANANQALLHYYFKSKEKLYEEVLSYYFIIEDEKLFREGLSKFTLTRHEELYIGIYLLVKLPFGGLDPDFSRIMSREVAEGRKHLRNLTLEYFLPRVKSFQEIIEVGVEEGVFETTSPHMVIMQMMSFVISWHNQQQTDEEDVAIDLPGIDSGSSQEVLDFLLNYTFKGLTPVGQVVAIPAIKAEVIDVLDDTIEEISAIHSGKSIQETS